MTEFSRAIRSVPDDAVAAVVPVLTVKIALSAGYVPTGATHENGVADVTSVTRVWPVPEQAEPPYRTREPPVTHHVTVEFAWVHWGGNVSVAPAPPDTSFALEAQRAS